MNQALQAMVMEPDIGELIGAAIKDIRLRTTETQDNWQEATGMSQSYVSAVERGKKGFKALRAMFAKVEKAGVDPMDIVRLAARKLERNPDEQRLLDLFDRAPAKEREAILTLLEAHAGEQARATR